MTNFTPDSVEKFLRANEVKMIVRSHGNPAEAIEKSASEQLITITTCANYNSSSNNACMLLIQKKLQRVSPKII